MLKVADTVYARISFGMLFTMAAGLVGGTTYIVSLSNASDRMRSDIADVQSRQAVIEEMGKDIAVIKTKLDSIEKSLNKR